MSLNWKLKINRKWWILKRKAYKEIDSNNFFFFSHFELKWKILQKYSLPNINKILELIPNVFILTTNKTPYLSLTWIDFYKIYILRY